MGQYLDFFMESIEALENKVAIADWKMALAEMLAYEAKRQESEVEQQFLQARRCATATMDDIDSNEKKLKQGLKWLASMHK